MVFATVLIHGVGITALARMLRVDPAAEEHHHYATPRVALLVLAIVLALVTLHGVEIWLYAGLYLALGAIGELETAVYFSTTTYAAIGFGDIHMARAWRLVGAIEGVNGVLLLGWSTAFFVSVVARLRLGLTGARAGTMVGGCGTGMSASADYAPKRPSDLGCRST